MNAASPTRGSTIGEEKKTNLSIGSSEIGGTTMCSPSANCAGSADQRLTLSKALAVTSRPPVHEKYAAEFNASTYGLGPGRRHKRESPSPNAMDG